MKKRVIGNWKMYVEKPKEALAIVAKLRRSAKNVSNISISVAPPFPLLPLIAKRGSIEFGGQTVSAHTMGAHTGEVSAATLKASGASFVIVGHSERRAAGETNKDVEAQIERALEENLQVVLCIGEVERDHAGAHFSFVAEQLVSALAVAKKKPGKLVIAYEPVWAIGKSAEDAMKAGDLEEMVIFIRKTLADVLERPVALRVPIVYGGSVEGNNAASLLQGTGIAGFLVGHASADIDSFIEIINACKK